MQSSLGPRSKDHPSYPIKDIPHISKINQLVSWYDLLDEVVELLVLIPLWGVIARAEGSR